MIIIGHRGARGLAPENTIAALAIAKKYKADMVEFDVRTTKDGVPVLFHNASVVLPSGEKAQIKHSSYEELKAIKPDLATLKEAMDFLGPKCPLYIELKQGVDVGAVIDLLGSYLKKSWPENKLAIASFDQEILRKVHRQLPKLPLIVNENWSGIRARIRARRLGSTTISMNQRWLWTGFISAMSRHGYTLYAYTLNSPAKAERWGKHGLAGVVTDYPDRFKNSTR
jgi:glycerophosphoryl diester phosphodiesterase